MKIGLVVPVKPSHPYLEDDPHRCLTSTICAFNLGLGSGMWRLWDAGDQDDSGLLGS